MHDLVIVSDLHLGRGLNKNTRRYFPLETFFFDDDFHGFCEFLVRRAADRGRGVKLIINGDGFDFLRIHHDAVDRTLPLSRQERFGPDLTPPAAAAMAAEILEGHPRFVAGLAHVLASGHSVVILPGNHDLEVHWAPVQQAIRAAVGPLLPSASDVERLEFHPWFYYEPGRVWVEHGCQYDPENAFRYPLRGRLADDPGFSPEHEADMPLGNFFQRYLYNMFGSITFIVPSSRANARYFRWLLLNEPRLLLRVTTSHIPFALQVLRRLAQGGKRQREQYKAEHERSLEALAQETGLGDKLKELDALKHPGADAVNAAQVIGSEVMRVAMKGGGVLFAFVMCWLGISYGIGELSVGQGLKTVLSSLANLALLAVAMVLGARRLLSAPTQEPPRPFRAAAEKICGITGAPLVVFGHTHDEVLYSLRTKGGGGEPAWYLNSGTWIAVFTHDVLMPRDRVQFSFVDVEGNDARLMRWNPNRQAAQPVVLLDDDAQPSTLVAPDSGAR